MNELMSQAIDLMIVGMGFVFVFLTILVGATSVMSKLVVRFEPPAPAKPAAKKPAPAKPAANNDPQLIAVISAAVAEYRSRQKK
ncbi:MAG: OadG family protein [Hahellaceae bacterium]|nr:OadG family protein [Hahellaceae bacterium]